MYIAVIGGAAFAALLLWLIWIIGARSQRARRVAISNLPPGSYKPVSASSRGSTIRGWLLLPEAAVDEPAHPEHPEHSAGADESEHPALLSGSETGRSGYCPDKGKAGSTGRLPLVVVMHGWGSNRSRVLRYTKPLLAAGWAVLMFDARCHGESDRIKAPTALMFRDDVETVVETACSLPEIDPERIAVVGYSLGGFGALLGLARGLPVRAVVTDSMPTRIETMMRADLKRRGLPFFPLGWFILIVWLLRAGISWREYKASQIPAALAANEADRRIPVLMIHAKDDPFIPADDLRTLRKPEAVRTLFVEGKAHNVSTNDPEFWKAVIPFLKEALEKAH